ncbi:MAG TPA: PH domain-containing protein [Candidatus Binataceae bacterium]|nr:PH domain-containing protein [Candidatus Binataceae bacterium]
MRCAQCGAEAAQGAAFCSRCGTRLQAPKPAAVREYALSRILPSWWHFAREIVIAIVMAGFGVTMLARGNGRPGILLMIGSVAVFGLIALARNNTSWSLTSDRLIERRGLLASSRREMELADVRSIEVTRSLGQRLFGLGDVMIASAASAEFLIRLSNIPDPEQVAEMLRQARLKRLA